MWGELLSLLLFLQLQSAAAVPMLAGGGGGSGPHEAAACVDRMALLQPFGKPVQGTWAVPPHLTLPHLLTSCQQHCKQPDKMVAGHLLKQGLFLGIGLIFSACVINIKGLIFRETWN